QKLQQALIDTGASMPITTARGTRPPDGIYGKETAGVVRAFHRRFNLKEDGIARRQTLSKLDQLFVGPLPVPPPPLPPQPPPPPTPPGADFARWRRALGGPRVQDGNGVDALIDGLRTFQAMVNTMRTATTNEHYIYLLGWWLSDDFPMVPSDSTSTVRRI